MAGRYYFLLTSLPGLPGLGEPPPIGLPAFRQLIGQEPAASRLVDALLLEGDLLLRESALAGQELSGEPAVLTAEQASGDEPLPEELRSAAGRRAGVPADAMWDAYYRYVHEVGRSYPNGFMVSWVGFEVALRNAIVVRRAAALELEAEEYLVAEDIADRQADVEGAARAWQAAADPLAALRVLDQHRWNWVQENAQYFSFAVDELAAYARGLALMTRWHLLRENEDAT